MLAVPSDGSNLLQHMPSQIIGTLRDDLQYPQTGRTSCNFTQPGASILVIGLAVPSDGSNLLQLLSCFLLRYRIEVLQYPHTGLTSCNNTLLTPEVKQNKFQGPPNGKNTWQPSPSTPTGEQKAS